MGKPPATSFIAYRLLRRLLRAAVRIFFRRVEVVGSYHVPAPGEGPVIFCGNHPNSLLDPIVITALCGRIVHFAAKDLLFRNPVMRFLLNTMGAVPMQRARDHGEGRVDNTSAFDSLFDVLAAGRAMGIFPEGLSNEDSQLSKIKTGAARIALGAQARHPETRLRIIPCGLYYSRRHRVRSSLLLHFGEPIELDAERMAAYAVDERATVRALTAEIETRLRSLTVNAEDWDTIRVLDAVRRLYQPPRIKLEERVELARRFNTVYPSVAAQPFVRSTFGRVQAYLDRLSAVGLTDRDLREPWRVGKALRRTIAHLMLILVWLPLAAAGALIHLPLAMALGWGGKRFAPRKDVVGTTKFLLSFFLVLLVYAALTVTAAVTVAPELAGWVALLLPLSGYAALRVGERTAAVSRLFTTTLRVFTLRREVAALRAERDALEEAVVVAVDRFKPEEMVAMFPRTPAAAPLADPVGEGEVKPAAQRAPGSGSGPEPESEPESDSDPLPDP